MSRAVLFTLVAVAALVLSPGVARADPPPGLGDCTFFPKPACDVSLVAELAVGGGQSHSGAGTRAFFYGFAETGVLFPVRGARHLHMGPVFALGIEPNNDGLAWVGNPRIRARWFVGGTDFLMEGGAGLQFRRYIAHEPPPTATHAGLMTELALGYHGIVAAWAEVGGLHDFGGSGRDEARWAAGIRANLVGWAAAFASIADAF